MKVQFDDRAVRARLGKAEFVALRAGATLSVALDWPGVTLAFEIAAGHAFGAEGEGARLRVTLPVADLDALAERLPARDGLRYAIDRPDGPVDLSVEVDLHDGRIRTR